MCLSGSYSKKGIAVETMHYLVFTLDFDELAICNLFYFKVKCSGVAKKIFVNEYYAVLNKKSQFNPVIFIFLIWVMHCKKTGGKPSNPQIPKSTSGSVSCLIKYLFII